MILSVNPVLPFRERNQEEGPTLQVRKPIDTKVRGVVLELITHAKGGLLSATSAPQIVIGLLPGFESGKMEHAPRDKRRSKLRITPLVRRVPIGLLPADSEGWLNALMQFILYVPGFAEAFYFAPRSLFPIREFIDHYHQDQQEGRSVSSANSPALFRYLRFKLPEFSFHEIFRHLVCLLQPKWEVHKHLSEALKSGGSTDLFVTQSSMKKQIFAEPGPCYDLDAFIEMRPDGPNVNYIPYVKMAGSWYQCDDERITQLRSDSLSVPLQRAVLSHFKRISFGKSGYL